MKIKTTKGEIKTEKDYSNTELVNMMPDFYKKALDSQKAKDWHNMKRRYLRKEIEIGLAFVTMIQFMFEAMVDDMTTEFIPIYLMNAVFIAFNIYFLIKYGKGRIYEK